MAVTRVQPPMPGTPIDDPIYYQFFTELYDRTGGDDDKVEEAAINAASGVERATTAQATADDAMTSIGSLETSVEDELRRLKFLSGAI